MKKALVLAATLILVGSPAFSAAKPTSLFLVSARQAERDRNHREAIYCLSVVLLEILECSPSSKGLNQKQITQELHTEFTKSGLANRAARLGAVNGKELKDFLSEQVSASNPGKAIDVYSDGTILVHSCRWKNPAPPRFSCVETPEVYRPNTEAYNQALSRYWWFELPSAAKLAKLPKYVEASKSLDVQDGAFKRSE